MTYWCFKDFLSNKMEALQKRVISIFTSENVKTLSIAPDVLVKQLGGTIDELMEADADWAQKWSAMSNEVLCMFSEKYLEHQHEKRFAQLTPTESIVTAVMMALYH
jgi:hypothetical protein